MTLSPEGCGVVEHPPECLCDVIIKEPITSDYPIIPHQIWSGVALAHYGKWDGTLVHWFDLMNIATDAISAYRNGVIVAAARSTTRRKMPDDVYQTLLEGIKAGVAPRPLVDSIKTKHNYTITRSYVVHLRKRLIKRGEL